MYVCLHLRECAQKDVAGDRYCFTVAFIPFVLKSDDCVCLFVNFFFLLFTPCMLNAFPLIIDFLTLGLDPKTLKDARTKLHANQMQKSIFCHFRLFCFSFFSFLVAVVVPCRFGSFECFITFALRCC